MMVVVNSVYRKHIGVRQARRCQETVPSAIQEGGEVDTLEFVSVHVHRTSVRDMLERIIMSLASQINHAVAD